MSMKRLIAGLVAVILTLSVVAKAHAMAGDLEHPSLAFPEDMPAALQAQIMAALSGKDAKFLQGHFINADTTLAYGGNTESLTSMLARFSECDGIRIKVSFVRGPAAESWTVRHNAWGDARYIGVQVNVSATEIDLQKLELPVFSNHLRQAVPLKGPTARSPDQ